MTNRITSGNRVDGLAKYVMDEKKRGHGSVRILSSQGIMLNRDMDIQDQVSSIKMDFDRQASLHYRAKNYIRHTSLSFKPEDKQLALGYIVAAALRHESLPLADDRITKLVRQIVDEKIGLEYDYIEYFNEIEAEMIFQSFMHFLALEYMKAMGIENTQYFIVQHLDRTHPHLHIVWNQINNTGDVISTQHDYNRGAFICRDITEKYELKFGESKCIRKNRNIRLPLDKVRYEMAQDVMECLNDAVDLEVDFAQRLLKKNIEMRLCCNGEGFIGVIFSRNAISFSGSRLDKNLEIKAIERHLKQNEIINKNRKEYEIKQSCSLASTGPSSKLENTCRDINKYTKKLGRGK